MKEDKEKWIDAVFDSLKGSQRAKPKAALFAKIESQIYNSEAKLIPLSRLRVAAAVAVLLLVLNVLAISQYTQASIANEGESMGELDADPSLISNYKLYE